MPADRAFHKPYVECFPRSYDEYPIFFSDEELEYLEGSGVRAGVERMRKHRTADYETLCEDIEGFWRFFQ